MNKKMSLGKHSRNPMKRTTSTTVLCNMKHGGEPNDDDFVIDQRFMTLLSSTTPVPQTASFLRSCFLCNRRLAPTRDIFMYKGNTAFCSEKCRKQQMNRDERKKRLNLVAAIAKEQLHLHSSSNSNPPNAPTYNIINS